MRVIPKERVLASEPPVNLWELFWADAGLHGCTACFPDSARSSLEAQWRRYFRALEGTSVLDIGTGRGAVLAYAASILGSDSQVTLTGVDLTQSLPVAPSWMRFRGGVDAASLPFFNRSFDHVTSQFGIEYSNFEAALTEAARVCARSMKMLVHAADGVITRQNGLQAEQVDWLLDDLGFMANLAAHFAAPTKSSAAIVNNLLIRISGRARVDENMSLLEGIYTAAVELQKRATRDAPHDIQNAIRELAGQLSQHRDRMKLLGDAGVRRARIDEASASLKAVGFGFVLVREERSGDDGQLIGYWLEAARNGKQEIVA